MSRFYKVYAVSFVAMVVLLVVGGFFAWMSNGTENELVKKAMKSVHIDLNFEDDGNSSAAGGTPFSGSLEISEKYEELNIKNPMGSIVIVQSSQDKTHVLVESENGNSENPFRYKVESNQLSLTGSLRPTAIRVELPKKWRGRINLKTISGDISIDEVSFEKLSVKSTSGSVKVIRGKDAEMVELHTISGSLSYQGFAKKIDAKTVSGSFRLVSPKGKKWSVEHKSVSGSFHNGLQQDTANPDGRLELKTVSGDITLETNSL